MKYNVVSNKFESITNRVLDILFAPVLSTVVFSAVAFSLQFVIGG